MISARRFAAAADIAGEKIIVVRGYHNISCEIIEATCEVFILIKDQISGALFLN